MLTHLAKNHSNTVEVIGFVFVLKFILSLSLYSISSLYIGAEFSGCRLGEVMSAAEINMSRLNALNSKLEIELASLEADEIRSSVKHQEEMRDKLRQKQSE